MEASPPPAKPTRVQRKQREELGTTHECKQPICGTGACCQQLGDPAWRTHRPEPMGQCSGCLKKQDMSWLLAAPSPLAATALSPLQVSIITPPLDTHMHTQKTAPHRPRFSLSYPHRQRGLSQGKPSHILRLLKTLCSFTLI